MKNKEKSENRKALPKLLGMVLVSAIAGGVFGLIFGFLGASNLSDRIVENIYTFLKIVSPWSVLVFSLLLLSIGSCQYRSAKKIFLHWDGEDEAPIERAEEKLSWGLLWDGLNVITNFLFFGVCFQVKALDSHTALALFLLSFILSTIFISLLQQKIVDLAKKINPEKKGSVYDIKFKKTWLSSCDESEQRQIGQASYKAFGAVNNTCVILWLILVLLAVAFDVGVLPFFLVALIMGVGQIVYILECIHMGRKKP